VSFTRPWGKQCRQTKTVWTYILELGRLWRNTILVFIKNIILKAKWFKFYFHLMVHMIMIYVIHWWNWSLSLLVTIMCNIKWEKKIKTTYYWQKYSIYTHEISPSTICSAVKCGFRMSLFANIASSIAFWKSLC